MTPERWQTIEELFLSALEREGSQRALFLEAACAGDPELRREVESLLASHEDIGSFLAAPAAKAAAELLSDAESRAGQRIGPYRVLRRIGQGGMGAVYLAERADDAYRKQVAIKLVKRGMDTDSILRRFRNERQILANLDHPNVAKLLEGGTTEDGLSYFIMDYVEGLPIDVYCDTHKLTTGARLKLFRTVCSAVQYAHQNRVVHRDLKPSNILVTADGVPKLLDFGIAKVLRPEASAATADSTLTGLRPMTPEYASPEQVRGEPITPASDIYSLGVLLYELLTGHRPYRLTQHTPQEIEQVICEQAPKRPSTAIDGVEEIPGAGGEPPITITPESVSARRGEAPEKLRRRLAGDLDHIVLMALRKEPARRYATAEQFGEDLGRHLEGRPVIARKDTLSYRSGKFIRRNRASVLQGVLSLVVLLALSSGGLYWLARRDAAVDKAIGSLAVLPLENLSHDPEQEYFADGMTEALISDLAQIRSLRTVSRTSVMRYKGVHPPLPEIARQLQVEALVEGSVLRAGDRVQISVRLIHARTDRPLWAKVYEHDLRDILALHREVAQAMAQEIQVKLAPQEQRHLGSRPPVDREAYEAYLKGRYHLNKHTGDSVPRAIEYFQQAIAKDPHYARAYAGLADAYSDLFITNHAVPPKEFFPRAKAAALKALALDERLAEAHTALGHVLFRYEWDRSGAGREYQRAMELDPNDAFAHYQYAMYLMELGRVEEALARMKRARELDPLSVEISEDLGACFYCRRQYDQAIAELRKAIELDPHYPPAHQRLGYVYEQTGRYDEALAEFQKAAALNPATPWPVAGLGYVYARLGQREEAQKWIDELKARSQRRYIPPQSLAIIYMGLGEKDQAFAWLEKAYEERSFVSFPLFRVNPLWDSLRSDPRFTDLMRRLGLPP